MIESLPFAFRFFFFPSFFGEPSAMKLNSASIPITFRSFMHLMRLIREKSGRFRDFSVLSLCVMIPNATFI